MILINQLTKSRCRFLSKTKFSLVTCVVGIIILVQILVNLILNLRQSMICSHLPNFNSESNTIYAITPTYSRYVQLPELTRLSHTFMLIPKLHWIIVEDSANTTELVDNFVSRLRYKFNFESVTNLFAPTPAAFKRKPNEPDWKYPKGVWQRNKALEWIRRNLNSLDSQGVLYFADDDNTYDVELFQEMRSTKKVSIWPVGLAGNLLVEKPIVIEGKVKSFNSIWAKNRPFPVDMAGFAVKLSYYVEKKFATFSSNQTIGYLESHFLSQLIHSWDELEPKADHCQNILVWHTKTKNPRLRIEKKLLNDNNDL